MISVFPLAISMIAGTAPAQGFKTVQETVRRPVAEIRNREHRETTYEPEYTTEMKQVQQTYLQPVVRYELRSRVVNWWNPLAPAIHQYYTQPIVRWEPRAVTQEMAVTTAKMKPVTRVVTRPTRVLSFVNETRNRVVRTPAPLTTAPILARTQAPLRPVFQVAPQPAAAAAPAAVAATPRTTTPPSRVTVTAPTTPAVQPAPALAARPVVNTAPGTTGTPTGGAAPPVYRPPAYRGPVYAAVPAPTYGLPVYAAPAYRAPVYAAPSQPAASVADRWGGVSRLDTDPPRYGRRLPGSGGAIIR